MFGDIFGELFGLHRKFARRFATHRHAFEGTRLPNKRFVKLKLTIFNVNPSRLQLAAQHAELCRCTFRSFVFSFAVYDVKITCETEHKQQRRQTQEECQTSKWETAV